jgi:DNA-binding HxlR family transcriptional regulator
MCIMNDDFFYMNSKYHIVKCASDKLAHLEQRHALKLLSCLYCNGKYQRSNLYNAISKTTTAPMKRVNELIALGLIKETVTGSAPFTKQVELTEKGKLVAEHIVEIEKILSEMP